MPWGEAGSEIARVLTPQRKGRNASESPNGEEPGVEVPLPHPGHLEVFQGAEQGEEIPGVVAVPFGGVRLQIKLPFLQHELLQEVFDQVLDLLGEPL